MMNAKWYRERANKIWRLYYEEIELLNKHCLEDVKNKLKKLGFRHDDEKECWCHPKGYVFEWGLNYVEVLAQDFNEGIALQQYFDTDYTVTSQGCGASFYFGQVHINCWDVFGILEDFEEYLIQKGIVKEEEE